MAGNNNDARGQAQSVGELVAKITAQFSALIRDEITYTKKQATAKAKKLGIGGVLIGAGVFLALYMFGMLLFAAAYGLATVLPVWAAFLIVAGALLLIIVALILVGVSRIKASQAHAVNPKEGLEKNLAAVKKGVQK